MRLISCWDSIYRKILCLEDIQLNAESMQKMPSKDFDLDRVCLENVPVVYFLLACDAPKSFLRYCSLKFVRLPNKCHLHAVGPCNNVAKFSFIIM